jgi:hypothetical protein
MDFMCKTPAIHGVPSIQKNKDQGEDELDYYSKYN